MVYLPSITMTEEYVSLYLKCQCLYNCIMYVTDYSLSYTDVVNALNEEDSTALGAADKPNVTSCTTAASTGAKKRKPPQTCPTTDAASSNRKQKKH